MVGNGQNCLSHDGSSERKVSKSALWKTNLGQYTPAKCWHRNINRELQSSHPRFLLCHYVLVASFVCTSPFVCLSLLLSLSIMSLVYSFNLSLCVSTFVRLCVTISFVCLSPLFSLCRISYCLSLRLPVSTCFSLYF